MPSRARGCSLGVRYRVGDGGRQADTSMANVSMMWLYIYIYICIEIWLMHAQLNNKYRQQDMDQQPTQ